MKCLRRTGLAVLFFSASAAFGATTTEEYECHNFGDIIGMAQYQVNNGETDPVVVGAFILDLLSPMAIGQTMEVWEAEEYATTLIEMKGRNPADMNRIGRASCVDLILVK